MNEWLESARNRKPLAAQGVHLISALYGMYNKLTSDRMATVGATVGATITSLSAAGIVYYMSSYSETLPGWVISLIVILVVPVIAYATSLGMSSLVRHNSKCKKMNMNTIAISNLFIALATLVTGILLTLENVPFLKFIFGEYEPTNPVTGLKIPKDAVEYNEYMLSGTHYKIQTFSNLVKDALPYAMNNKAKDGIVYLYYMFFMTLLPSFFIYTSQAIC